MSNPLSWYSGGLRFKCTECGQCCTGAPGYVWVSIEDIKAISSHLHLSVEEFSKKYVRKIGDRYSLIEKSVAPDTHDCIFLKNKKCQIYSTRPTQCRTFPWWPTLLTSEKEWEQASLTCEGINMEAPIVPLETIQEQLEIHKQKSPA